jgi:hypothetical protein
VDLVLPKVRTLRVMPRPARGVSMMVLLVVSCLPLPSSLAQEIATKDDLSGIYMLYAASQLCIQDFNTFSQEHLDGLTSAARDLEEALELSAEEMQALREKAESAATALHSFATPQNQAQQCQQLRGMVDVHLQEKKSLDFF